MTKSTTRTKADLQTYTQTDIDAKDVVAKAGRKNLIINGGMQVSQRGDYTSATGTPVGYYLDRFYHEQTTLTTSFQHITTSINGVTKKALRINLTSTGSGEAYVMQRMEDANLQIGATYTFSAWVKSNNTSVGLRFNNGVAWQPVSVTHSGSGNWEHLSAQVTITGLSNTFTCQFLATSATSGDYFEFTEVQLELGSVATDFEHRSYGEELALCQRYYQTLDFTRSMLGILNRSTSSGAGLPYAHFVLPTTMRAYPSMTTTGTWGTASDQGGIPTLYEPSYSNVTLRGNNGSITAGGSQWLRGGFCNFDAEL